MTRLLTARLELVPVWQADAEALVAAMNDPLLRQFTLRLHEDMSAEEFRDFQQDCETAWGEGRSYQFSIIDRETGAPIGGIGFRVDANSFGYWLTKEARGKGLMSEAVTSVLAYLFDVIGVEAIKAGTDPENHASRRILDKQGFQPTGCIQMEAANRGGALVDCNMLILTQDAYRLGRASAGCFGAAGVSLSQPLVLVAAAVLIDRDGRVLLAQRPEGKSMAGLWEFPGGKVQDGESPELALVRELHEELGIDVTTSCLAPLTFASHAYEGFHLLMPLYAIRVWDGEPQSREGQALKWVALNQLRDYPMPPADLPLVPLLFDLLG